MLYAYIIITNNAPEGLPICRRHQKIVLSR
jgi:hypothetical protein